MRNCNLGLIASTDWRSCLQRWRQDSTWKFGERPMMAMLFQPALALLVRQLGNNDALGLAELCEDGCIVGQRIGVEL